MYKISQLALKINDGQVGVMPTDTLYGLVAKATNKVAVKRLYDLKSREFKPGTIIASSIDQLVELGFKKRYLKAVEQYWPGAISVITPTGPILAHLHLGKYSLAIRIPDGNQFNELLSQTGPLLTTSANLPGKIPAKNIAEAKQYFGKLVDFYEDGGVLLNEPSTIIRIVDDAVEVVRKGSVKIDEQTGRIIR